MRDFSDKDRTKKRPRIQLGENPANLSSEMLALLESAVKDALKDGCLPCPVGWKTADDLGVPRIAIGPIVDRLGVRIANCQMGFFRVEKTPCQAEQHDASPELVAGLRELDAGSSLTCRAAAELARRLKTTPMNVSKAAGVLGLKIRECQLGCF